jgi:gas vesicle protein
LSTSLWFGFAHHPELVEGRDGRPTKLVGWNDKFIKNKTNGKEDVTMAGNGSDRGGFWRGLLIGGFLGAVAGILFAPKSGKELRSDIRKKAGEALDEAKEFYSEAQVKAKAILDDARHRAEELKKEANRQLAEARLKAKEILKGVEEKTTEVSQLAKEVIEETKMEAKKVKEAATAGFDAARQELSKKEDKNKAKT